MAKKNPGGLTSSLQSLASKKRLTDGGESPGVVYLAAALSARGLKAAEWAEASGHPINLVLDEDPGREIYPSLFVVLDTDDLQAWEDKANPVLWAHAHHRTDRVKAANRELNLTNGELNEPWAAYIRVDEASGQAMAEQTDEDGASSRRSSTI